MAHFSPANPNSGFAAGRAKHQVVGADSLSDEDDDSLTHHHDRITRRNYLATANNNNNNNNISINIQQAQQQLRINSNNSSSRQQETIQVKLNESYFANEKKALVNALANCRQKLNSLQMFNPAKNQSMREQQEQQWDENEKYTLDSLNEIKSGLDEQFQWSRPEDKREIWGSKLQYFFAITSYSIGLGNVIRFPILVQKNGGLAFIIPFVIMLVVEGIPLFYLELAVGQRMRKAAISCWNLVSPFAAGIGLASAAVSFIIGLYYNTMVAWTLLYLWGSASSSSEGRPLAFAKCPAFGSSSDSSQLQQQARSSNHSENQSTNETITSECQIIGPFQHYWYRQTLNISDSVNHWNNFNWPIFLALCLAWLISHVCLSRGLSSSKRIVYFTFTLPYVILTIFFFKATSLKGMSDGVYYLFEPEWSKLADPYVWLQSAAQVFFSLGLGFGGLIALSSYNPVNNNCYKDAIKVSLINFSTSIYAGIVIFAILGYKANLSYDKCLVEREQKIEYYLSDYNLKVIDYGSVFDGVIKKSSSLEEGKRELELEKKNMTLSELEGSALDYYDSSDAIASIRSLDRGLDAISDSGTPDEGDRDTEFIIDASNLISDQELERVISDIPGLPQCSVRQELEQSTQGTGLVFVVMAEALSEFNSGTTASYWAAAFFFMLLMLGLDSQFGNLEGLLSSLADLNFANSIKRQWITGFICCISLGLSVILFAHGAGSYMFAIFDEYAGSFSLVLIAIFELIAISYIYGLKRFCDDCELMTGKRPPFIILLSWRYISPILLLVVTLATLREFSVSLSYEAWIDNDHLERKLWPAWCVTFGLFLIAGCVLWIPAVAILRSLRINLIPEESLSQCWFPAEELREFHELQEEHKVTKLERVLFGFRSDDD